MVPNYLMFIRVKNIKNKKGRVYPYAYLVDNRWYKRGTRQKGQGSRQIVKKYLGRVYSHSKTNDIGFYEHYKIENIEGYNGNHKEKILKDLVDWELFRHNIDVKEYNIDHRNKKVVKSDKEISLKLNEGLLCSYTLGRLHGFRFTGDERQDGLRFAKAFVEAGLEIPKEVFIGLFSKVYK